MAAIMRGDHTEQTMPRTLHDAVSAPAALTAFLRGVERRGAVFAQLQVGDAATGDRALVAAMRAFRLPAAKIPFADWPRHVLRAGFCSASTAPGASST